MMTLTGEWNTPINAFPAFAGAARVALVGTGWRSAAFPGSPRRR